MHREMIHPSFGIGPHDRAAITWDSAQVDLSALQEWHDNLVRLIISARLVFMYRRAGRTRRIEVSQRLQVVQQAEYATDIKNRTEDFTKWPALDPQTIIDS